LQAALDAAYAVDMTAERERIATAIESIAKQRGLNPGIEDGLRTAVRIARQGADQ
jgi:hypothetical protein